MHLNWEDSAIHFHPKGIGPAPHGIPLPYYGNYGGPGWSAGQVGGDTPLLPPSGNPADVDPAPVDGLDTAFYLHDLAYQLNPGLPLIPAADFQLLQTIDSFQFTNPEAANYGGDMEASLYAGFASLSFIGLLVTNPEALALLIPAEIAQLPGFTTHAIQDMEAGLAAEPGEARSLHGALHVFEAQYLPQIEAQFGILG